MFEILKSNFEKVISVFFMLFKWEKPKSLFPQPNISFYLTIICKNYKKTLKLSI